MEYKNNAIKEMMDSRIENSYPGINTIEDPEEAKDYINFCDRSGYKSLDSFRRFCDIKRKARAKGVGSIVFHSDVYSFRKGVVPASPDAGVSEYLEVTTKYGSFYIFKNGFVSEYLY